MDGQRAKGVAQPCDLKSCKGPKEGALEKSSLSCTPFRMRSGTWRMQGGVQFLGLIPKPSMRNTATR